MAIGSNTRGINQRYRTGCSNDAVTDMRNLASLSHETEVFVFLQRGSCSENVIRITSVIYISETENVF